MLHLWLKELWRLAVILAVSLLLGLASGSAPGFVIAGLSLFLVWHLIKLYRFARWLMHGNLPEPAVAYDVWGELYYQVHKLRARGAKRERKLKDLIERYRASAAALPDAAVVIRGDGLIEWMNEAAAELLGLHLTSDIGQRIDNLIRHPDFVHFLHAGEYAEPVEVPSPVDEQKRLLIHVVPYGDDQRLLVARDISKLHKLEVMRRDFIANLSHELSTPLTVISGYLEALEGRARNEQQREQAWRQIRLQTDRMRSLVNDLLQISRLEMNATGGSETAVDVPGMIKGLLADAAILSGGRRHTINMELEEGLRLRGGAKDLYSAFANLVRNAVQYTPDGGTITVRWSADTKGAHFEVRDTGIGIPPQAIPRLTERFYRVDAGRSRSVGGTGLGLAIVKHVLRNHDAVLRVESTPGTGSVFYCDFPLDRVVLKSTERAKEQQASGG